jgi:hypothetical protein
MHQAACSIEESEPLGGMGGAKLVIILVDKALKDPVETFQDGGAVSRALFPRDRSDLGWRTDCEQQT